MVDISDARPQRARSRMDSSSCCAVRSAVRDFRQANNRLEIMRSSTTKLALLLCLLIGVGAANGQKDPGTRTGAPAAGGPYLTLTPSELSLFSHAFLRFAKSVSVSGTIEKGKGLGPTFNGNACTMCHAQPTAGGSSPGLTSPDEPHPNPQVALAKLDGATNSVPSFITVQSPVLVARFVRKPDGSADGEVHAIYTIAGRTDAKGCTLAQPDFAQQLAENNVVFRVPTPLFGLGLVENTSDATLRANLVSTEAARSKLGIGGRFNLSANDGSIMRFGWKAQNKSLLMSAAEAANVEEGVTNDLFPNEHDAVPGCVFNATRKIPATYSIPTLRARISERPKVRSPRCHRTSSILPPLYGS